MDPDDSDDEPYPGSFIKHPGQLAHVSTGKDVDESGDEDDEDEEDNVHVVQQKKHQNKASLFRRKEEDEEDESEALVELQKSTKSSFFTKAQPADKDEEEEEDNGDNDDDADGSGSYRLWCKNSHRLFKVIDSAVVRESRHALELSSREHYGQLVSSNADSLWCAAAV